MPYIINIDPRGISEDIPKIQEPYRSQINRAIMERLTTNPVGFGKPLQYSLKGFRRLRIGDWRVIYRIEGNTVQIIAIGLRRDIYED